MITRMWRGWAGSAGSADAYEELLGSEILPALGGLPAFRGATVLRRELGEEVEFVVLTRFDSLAGVAAFAGGDIGAAVIEPRARALLARFDEHVSHYETALELTAAPG
jgi:antibiotic biosynthesis monooxygenase (ABM) superfamily enzyme